MYPTFEVLGGVSGEPVCCRASNPTKMKKSSSNIMEKALLLTILHIPMLLLCTLAVPVWSSVVIVW